MGFKFLNMLGCLKLSLGETVLFGGEVAKKLIDLQGTFGGDVGGGGAGWSGIVVEGSSCCRGTGNSSCI